MKSQHHNTALPDGDGTGDGSTNTRTTMHIVHIDRWPLQHLLPRCNQQEVSPSGSG